MFFQKKFAAARAAFVPVALFAALCFYATNAFAQQTAGSTEERLAAWEKKLDAIYTPDPAEPEIPFRVEKFSDPAVAEKRAAYKTKLRTVSKFKEKAKPEEIDKFFAKISPTPDEPLVLSITAKLRKEIREKIGNYGNVPARLVFPHPSAKIFPGDVPETFKRVGKPFYPDPKNGGWQSTGLYAAPGEIVKVRVSKSAVGSGLKIRIGCHTDNLLDSRQRYWRRFPCVTREYGIDGQSFEIASPFGGLIYVRVSQNRVSARTQVIFSGVVEAPFFVLDKTKPNEWNHLRYAPAPWAELIGKNFAATIPSDEAVQIDDPVAVIRFWDNVVAELDKLTCGPKERSAPIRFVVDVEPATAVGHAGDPIVGNALWARAYRDLEYIRKNGSWEIFLSLAKNSLDSRWVFDGDRDTPAALLALFCMEKATGKKAETFFNIPALQTACFARLKREETEEKNRKAMRETAKRESKKEEIERKKIFKDKSSGKGRSERLKAAETADIPDTRHDPGVPFQRLSAYLPIVAETGWDTLAKTFKRYTVRNRLPLNSNEEKKKTFVMLWSGVTKKNLSPFLENFGFPKQNGAGNYPDFQPENFPPSGDLRPENGGTGFLGTSMFPTIAMLNENYRVQQIPQKSSSANAFGEAVEDVDFNENGNDENADEKSEDEKDFSDEISDDENDAETNEESEPETDDAGADDF